MSRIGYSTYRVSDMIVSDNYMPIQLTWEDLFTEEMPKLRKNQKDAEMAFMVLASKLDDLDVAEKNKNRWVDGLIMK
jgi:hypothetical protein